MRNVEILLPMEAGPALRLPDELVRIARDFCDAALENGIWVRDMEDHGFFDGRGGYRDYVHLQRWYRPLWGILAMFRGGEVAAAFALLNTLLDRLHSIARMEGLYVMLYLWNMTSMFRAHDRALGDILAKHTAEVMRVVFGPRHPMRLMWEKIEELPPDERPAAIGTAVRSVLGYFREAFGPLDVNTFEITRLYMRQLGLEIRTSDSRGEKESRLAEIESLAGPLIEETSDENLICDMLSRLALARLSADKVEEAETALNQVGPWVGDTANIGVSCWMDIRWDYNVARADACAKKGKHDEAAHYPPRSRGPQQAVPWQSGPKDGRSFGEDRPASLSSWTCRGEAEMGAGLQRGMPDGGPGESRCL